MTATQKHDIIPICTTVLSADQPPKEDIMLDQQKITILYCRLSNEDAQEGESNSIANQREYLTRYARDHGYTNLKILVDDGYTGTNLGGPAFAPFCWGYLSLSALTGQSSAAHSS